MLRSSLLLVVGCALHVPALAQYAQTELRAHPESATRVLASHPSEQRAIYAADGALLFEANQRLRRVDLPAVFAGVETSASGERAVALTKSASSVGLQFFLADGTPTGEHTIAQHPDERLPRVAVSDAGPVVAFAKPSTGEICFADEQRAAPDCTALFRDAAYSNEREVLLEYSPDGRYLAVAAQRVPAGPEMDDPDSNVHLFLFDADGMLLWERTLAHPSVQALGVSPDSDVAVSTYDSFSRAEVVHKTTLVSSGGRVSAEAPYGADEFTFRDGAVLLQSARSLALLRTDDQSAELLYRPPTGVQILDTDPASLSDTEDGEISVVTGRGMYAERGFAFTELRLLHLDTAGAVRDELRLDIPPQHSPRLHATAGSTSVILDDAIRTFTK